MATGSVQQLVVCMPSGTTQHPCPDGSSLTTAQGYVLDPAQQAAFEASVAPFDYAAAAGIFTAAFTFVVALYLVAKSVGLVLSVIRR